MQESRNGNGSRRDNDIESNRSTEKINNDKVHNNKKSDIKNNIDSNNNPGIPFDLSGFSRSNIE